MFKNTKKTVGQLFTDIGAEYKETRKAAKLVWKRRKGKLTEEEELQVKMQSLDLLKFTFLAGLFLIPFSGIVIVVLIKFGKKVGIKVLPSSFEHKKENDGKEENQNKKENYQESK